MRHRCFSVLVVILCFSTVKNVNAATIYNFSGNSCVSGVEEFEYMQHSIRGLQNASPVLAGNAFCPVAGFQSATVDVSLGILHFTDESPIHAVTCKMYFTTTSGVQYFSPTAYSCTPNFFGFAGCATNSEPNFMGTGSMGLDVGSLSAISNVASYGFSCSIPKRAGSYFSTILGYTVWQVDP